MMICTVDSSYDMVASHVHTTVFMYDPLILQHLFAVFGPLEKDRFSSILEPRSPPPPSAMGMRYSRDAIVMIMYEYVATYIPYCNMYM